MIPILLDKTKTLAELVSSKTGGIGDITGAYDGVAVEEANGLKEITFKLPISSPRYSQIIVGSYIKAKVDDLHVPQIYEVYKITKPMKGIVTVKAQHISYILGKATVMPFETTGITMVTVKMIQNLVGTFPFTFDSDIVNSASAFKIDKPMSFRNAIGGWKGSILDVFGGELDWDNLDVHLYAHRGRDRGVKIEYGKNLVDLTQEESNANVYDAVIGYAIKDETTYVGDIQKITTTNSPRTLNVDFTSAFDYDETPTVAKLNQLALAYAQNNNIGIPKINLKVSFEPLAKFSEYEDIALLEQTGLFDTVNVVFPKLGVYATAKVIRTEYDFINEKPISIELGNAKTNLISLIDTEVEENAPDIDIEGAVNNAIGQLDSYIKGFSETIANSLGLFYTRVETSGGGFQIYLHNKPTLSASQYQWTINAGGFAVSQDYGQTWTAGIDPNGDAVFNSMSANIVRALKVYGSYIQGSQIAFGDPTDPNGKYIIAEPYDGDNDGRYDGVSFDGNGYVRFQPTELFSVRNLASDGTNAYNTFSMSKGTTSPQIYLINYDDTHNYLYANWIALVAHTSNSGGSIFNQLRVANDATASGTRYNANMLLMEGFETSNHLYLRNFKTGASRYGNFVQLDADATSLTASIGNHGFTSTSSTSYANRLLMTTTASQSRTRLINNDPTLNTSANEYEMNTTATSRYSNLFNYDFNTYTSSSGNLGRGQANRIFMSSSSSTNGLCMYNNITVTSGEISANQLIMTSASSMNRYSLYNNKANDTGSANSIMMIGTPLGGGMTNSISINNYDVDGNNLSDTLYMGKSSSDNTVYLRINRGGNNVGEVKLNRDSSGLVTIGMYVRGGSYGYSSASFEINSNGQAKINGNTLNFSGGYVRY